VRNVMFDAVSKHIFYPLWDIKNGSVTLKALKELERTQWLSERELKVIQWTKVREILAHAYLTVPYYREVFDKNKIRIEDIHTEQDFRSIPLLTKTDVREQEERLISEEYQKAELIRAKTGGSTGEALFLWFDRDCGLLRSAAALRSDRWTGWDLGVWKGLLWGNPLQLDSVKKKIKNYVIDRVCYLDTVAMNVESMKIFSERLKRSNIGYLFGHAHSIYVFARFCEENTISLKLKGIISTSMTLMNSERDVIEEVFQCNVQDRYGCEEVSLIASECEEHCGLHVNMDHLFVEVLKKDHSPAQPGEEGSIIVTDLINRGMPFLRYEVGDYGILSERVCRCGRGFPLIEKVVGRIADFLLKRDGTMVAGISLIERTLTRISGINQMQIIQNEFDTLILNVVKGVEYSKKSEETLIQEFKTVFGDIQIRIRYVDAISQGKSGKYRFSICNINR
jgi:phenylacetate-CoA ligase